MSRKQQLRRRRALMAAVAAIAAFVVLELGAGAFLDGSPPAVTGFFPPQDSALFRADRELFWTLRPGATRPGEDIRINRHGFRGPAIGAKKSGVLRVITLGDSVTFGFKVREHESYPSRLTRLLDAQFRVETINAGVPGYSSLQGRRQFERDVLPLQPDLIIVSFGNNDILDAVRHDRDVPVYPAWIFAARELLGRTNLARLIAGRGGNPPPTQRCLSEDVAANLVAIDRLAREHGTRAVFFHPLHAVQKDFRLPVITLPTTLERVDLAAAFIAADPDSRMMFQGDHNHPNAAGHALIARTLAKALVNGNAFVGFERRHYGILKKSVPGLF